MSASRGGAGRIFILAEVRGAVGERIHAIQKRFDPKLANSAPPHLTLAGSSGVGPVHAGTSVDALRTALEPVAATIAPICLRFAPPHRFMQTDVVVLPLDPHGPLRELHDAIARGGLRFSQARHTFTPHVTLSFYPELTSDAARALLGERIDDPVVLDRFQVYLTREPQRSKKLFELELRGTAKHRK